MRGEPRAVEQSTCHPDWTGRKSHKPVISRVLIRVADRGRNASLHGLWLDGHTAGPLECGYCATVEPDASVHTPPLRGRLNWRRSQDVRQKASCKGFSASRNVFRSPLRDNPAATLAAFRPQ